MLFFPDEKIIIPENRQRREFDSAALYELECSIASNSLLHPIVLRSPDDPSLVAGERRLRACRSLLSKGRTIRSNGQDGPVAHIPVAFLGDLPPEQYEEIELEENVQRVDLTWQEKTDAVARLHKLRKKQDPQHTAKQTVEEILGRAAPGGSSTYIVGDALKLSEYMDRPEVAKAKTRKEALKAVKKIEDAAFRAARLEEIKNQDTQHTLLQGDCREVLLTLPDATYDCIITDPPYGIQAQDFGSQTSLGHHYADDTDYAMSIIQAIATEGWRCTKASAHLYLFADFRHYSAIREILARAGWSVWPTPIIWRKRNTKGMLPRPEHGPRRTYEIIIYALKGDKKVTGIYPDVIEIDEPMVPVHAAEKPVDLYINLLNRSCYPGDIVLDPCAGSGPVFPAANYLQLVAHGINLTDEDYALAHSRMEE